jgi:hypothetical protein
MPLLMLRAAAEFASPPSVRVFARSRLAGVWSLRVDPYALLGSTVGIDLREFFEGKFGDVKGQWLPSGRGFRLRLEEWEALKTVSGNIDEAIKIMMQPSMST